MISTIVISLLLGAIGLSVVRLLLGPTSQDRVLALDVLAVLASAFLVYWSLLEKTGLYIDVVLVTAAAVFLVTIVFARFLERGIK